MQHFQMKHVLWIFSAIVAAIVSTLCTARADTRSNPEAQAAQFLLGTWSCHHTEDSATEGEYTTTYASALNNAWLKQTWDFPKTASYPGMQGDWFFGYDPRVNKWVRFGAMSDGMYFAMVGQHQGDSWSWSYVLPTTKASSVLTKKSDSEYTVDGPSYSINGKPVTEHHECKKV